ncbi:MAG: hypothetical protein M1830_001378 [Pleopsidium flavum]|nr:MAG: hypothetical protein M1830_001378 [Pleopsidium flavum]
MAVEAVPEAATQVSDLSVSPRDKGSTSTDSHSRSSSGDARHETRSEGSERPEDNDRPQSDGPPLPREDVPPLPDEAPPAAAEDDGWAPVWDDTAQAYYFFNRFSGLTQWTNPRVPEVQPTAPGVGNYDRIPDATSNVEDQQPARPYGGYDPAIHGDYDPTASYAQEGGDAEPDAPNSADPNAIYTATGVFNRFTGKWQPTTLAPENFNDENKSKRQMSAFFDVDAAANSHNGKSLKAERSGKKLTKQELKAFKEKRRERKEEKRRAWLRD